MLILCNINFTLNNLFFICRAFCIRFSKRCQKFFMFFIYFFLALALATQNDSLFGGFCWPSIFSYLMFFFGENHAEGFAAMAKICTKMFMNIYMEHD